MEFGSGGAGFWDGIFLWWCWVVGWHSVAVVLGCGMAFGSGSAGL